MQLETDKMIARKEGGIGWMVFNNPDRRNALALEMQKAIPVILDDFRDDPDVRVVVMTGAGEKAFVSGADISEFENRRSDPASIAEYNRISGDATRAYAELGKPLIAMIRGFCMGGRLTHRDAGRHPRGRRGCPVRYPRCAARVGLRVRWHEEGRRPRRGAGGAGRSCLRAAASRPLMRCVGVS